MCTLRHNYLNGLTIGIVFYILLTAFPAASIAKEPLLELTCVNDAQCNNYKNDTMKVRCENLKCQCTLLATQQPTDCIPKETKLTNIISGPCPCKLPHSVCNEEEKSCYCEENFIPSEDLRRCLPRVLEKDENCELDVQCRITDEFSVCDRKTKKCKCQENNFKINGTCVHIAQRISCETHEICNKMDSHLHCAITEQHLCVCESGYVYAIAKNGTNATCLPALQYQETCLSDGQCQHALGLGLGAECNSLGMCDCNNRHFARQIITPLKPNIRTKCESLMVPAEYCRNDMECYQHNLEPSEQTMHCYYAACQCKYGYLDEDNLICNTRTSRAMGLWNMNGYSLLLFFFCSAFFPFEFLTQN